MPSVPIFCRFEVGGSQVQNCFKLCKKLAPKAHLQVKFCSDPVRSEDYFPEWKPALSSKLSLVPWMKSCIKITSSSLDINVNPKCKHDFYALVLFTLMKISSILLVHTVEAQSKKYI